MKLYREHVLGEKPQVDIVPLTSIAPAPIANGRAASGGNLEPLLRCSKTLCSLPRQSKERRFKKT
jgi:hypothetical protein